jgi:hypothetical protein
VMNLEYDLKKLFMDSLALQPGENVIFINDLPRNTTQVTEAHQHRTEMTRIWHQQMLELGKITGFSVQPVVTIDLREPNPGKFDADGYVEGRAVDLGKILDALGEKDIVVAITGPSITGELVRRLGNQKFRFASAPNVRIDFEGFKADYSKIPLRFEILTHRMARAFFANMTFRLGDLVWKCTFDLRGQRYQFKECGAAHRPGEFINYPSGCANVQPYAGIEGDARGKSLSEGEIPAILDDELVVYRIKENAIHEILGEGEAAEKERASVLDPAHPEVRVITKLGMGVNDQSRCNGTHVGDEKTMGMHWAYGPKKRFPDTIWSEHPIDMDIDFVYPDGIYEPIMRSNIYTANLGELF